MIRSKDILRTILPLCALLILFSCKEDRKIKALSDSIESNLNRKITIPDSLKEFKPFENYKNEDAFESNLKIVTSINASCATCVSKVNDWQLFSEELISKDISIPIIPIFDSSDDFQLLFYSCENLDIPTFNFPFYLDYNDEFSRENLFINENESFRTVLINEENKVILIGSPVDSPKLKELYQSKIKELL